MWVYKLGDALLGPEEAPDNKVITSAPRPSGGHSNDREVTDEPAGQGTTTTTAVDQAGDEGQMDLFGTALSLGTKLFDGVNDAMEVR